MRRGYPSDIEEFIRQELASGHYSSEHELVCDALRVFRELKTGYRQLYVDIQESIAQIERGEVTPFEAEEFKRLAGGGSPGKVERCKAAAIPPSRERRVS